VKPAWPIGLVAAAVALIVAANSLFLVDQRQQALVLSFGTPIRVINAGPDADAGLQGKVPFAERVVTFDRRWQMLEANAQSATSADGRPYRFDVLFRYRIVDPLAFYETFGDPAIATDRLKALASQALRQAAARMSGAELAAGGRADLMAAALSSVQAKVSRQGVRIDDLRFDRALPAAGSDEAIYRRMRAGLEAKAAGVRATDDAQARQITTDANAQASDILARANEEAAALRGSGEAQAAQLYAASYGKDADFAAFYRSMQAYDAALARPGATIVIPADSPFLSYFQRGPRAR
jgi:membrane protease subunit HflC